MLRSSHYVFWSFWACGHTSKNFCLLKIITDWCRLSKQVKESLVLEVFKQLLAKYLLQTCKESIMVNHQTKCGPCDFYSSFQKCSLGFALNYVVFHEIQRLSTDFFLQNSVLNLIWQPLIIVMFSS